MGRPLKYNLTDKTFGLLTVTTKLDNPNKSIKDTYWKCICKCGNVKNTYGRYLREGVSTHCGCQRSYSNPKYKRVNLNRIYSCNEPDIAYILGFVAADGYVKRNSLKLSLKGEDIEHLKAIRRTLKVDSPIKMHKAKCGNKLHDTVTLSLYDKQIGEAFNTWGIKSPKSLTLSFPSLKKNLYPEFIRGYFDGDGSAVINEPKRDYCITFASGSKPFLLRLKNILNKNNIKTGELYSSKASSIHTFRVSAKGKNIENFYEYLYKKDTISLKRKKKIIENMIRLRKTRNWRH